MKEEHDECAQIQECSANHIAQCEFVCLYAGPRSFKKRWPFITLLGRNYSRTTIGNRTTLGKKNEFWWVLEFLGGTGVDVKNLGFDLFL